MPNVSHLRARTHAQVCFVAILFLAMLLLPTGCHKLANSGSEAKITFTQVPQWDLGDLNQTDVIEGKVSGSRPGQKIVLYSKTGDLWWLQPRLISPTTPILPGGVWRNEVHLATHYAALLVDSTYSPMPVLAELPKPSHGIDTVAASRGQEHSSSFFVNFSGLFGTELSYRIGEHYRLALNPGLRYPFGSIYKSQIGVKSMPLTMDVGLKFKYFFR